MMHRTSTTAADLLQAIVRRLDRGGSPDRHFPDRDGEYWALCPFHPDKHPDNFSVSEPGYHCFACGASGGLWPLAEKLGVIPPGDASRTGGMAGGGLLLIDHLTGKGVSYNKNHIPFCVYTRPEIASIGMTQEEAEKSQETLVGKFPFAGAGRAQSMMEEEGIVKFVVDKKYGEILGVHILGPQATELIIAGFVCDEE